MTLSITRAGTPNSLPVPANAGRARPDRALPDQSPPVAAGAFPSVANSARTQGDWTNGGASMESPEPSRFERVRALDPQQSFGATLYAAAERGDSGEYRGRRLDLRI